MTVPIAVLLPVYGGDKARWFSEAIDSIRGQSGMEGYSLRVYLGIDGEIDADLSDVIGANRDLFFTVVHTADRTGLAANLNRLIARLSDEEFVLRADADDRSRADRFSTQLDFLRKNREVGIIGCFLRFIDEEGAVLARSVRYPTDHARIIRYFPFGNPLAHPTVCIRRTCFELMGAYDPRSFPEDLNLWFRAARRGVIFANIPEVLVDFRVPSDFAKKRGRSWAVREFTENLKGLRGLGQEHLIAIPLMRLCFRLSPSFFINFAYRLRGSFSEPRRVGLSGPSKQV